MNKIKTLYGYVLTSCCKAFPLWCLFVLLMALPCCLSKSIYGEFHFAKMKFLAGTGISVIYATVFVSLSCWKRFLKISISAILWFLLFVELFLFVYFDSRMSDSIIDLVRQTDSAEAKDFFSMYVFNVKTLVPLAICLVIALIYMWIRGRWNGNCMILNKRWFKISFPLINLCSAVLAYLSLFTTVLYLWLEYPTVEQFGMSVASVKSYNKMISTLEQATENSDGRIMVSRRDSLTEPPSIIYVIGESFNPRHSPLYGYPLMTTPEAYKEWNDGNLLVFNDVVTPACTTDVVLNYLFTTSPESDEKWNRPIFPTIFKNAGYVTSLHDIWTSPAQSDMKWTSGCLFFLKSKKIQKSAFDYRNTNIGEFDYDFFENELDSMKLIVRDIHEGGGRKPFISIFHMRGQHMPASDRYTPEYKVFSEEDYEYRTDLDDSQKEVVAHYDNATFYNDAVIRKFFDAAKEEDAILIYHSDHGEEVHDYRNNYGRSLATPNIETVKYIYTVPFYVFTTANFREKHPELYSKLEQSTSVPMMLSDISQFLMGIAGIESRFYDSKRDPLSDDYHVVGRRILNEEYDYDLIVGQNGR